LRTGSGEDTSVEICPEDSREKSRSPRVEACSECVGNKASILKMNRQAQGYDIGQFINVLAGIDICPRRRALLPTVVVDVWKQKFI
jgi:hypothetical protein